MLVEAAASEKKWMHERLGWLLVSQPVLLGVITLAAKPEKCGANIADADACANFVGVVSSIPLYSSLVGLAISGLVLANLWAAGRMHLIWNRRIRELASQIGSTKHERVTRWRFHGWLPVRTEETVTRFYSSVTFGSRPRWPAMVSSIAPAAIALVFALMWMYIAWRLRDWPHWIENYAHSFRDLISELLATSSRPEIQPPK